MITLSKITEEGGVYFLKKNGVVIYVGQSGNVRSRIRSHILKPLFDSVEIIPKNNKIERQHIEREAIYDICPSLNGHVNYGYKCIRVADDLHAKIKLEAFKRRHKLEFFTAELLRAGLRSYSGTGKSGGAK